MSTPPTPPDPAPEEEPRRGLDLARQALAAAKAEAKRRGLRTGAGGRGGGARDAVPGRRRWPADDDTRSGAHPDDRDPQTLDTAVDRLVSERGWETDKAVGAAMGRWPAVVGPEIAAHSTPVSYADGELVVTASSTAWATQLRMMAPVLLSRLSAELGPGTVTRLTVHGPRGPSWTRGPLRVKGRGPRDTYG